MLVLKGNDCIPYSGKVCQLVENRIYAEEFSKLVRCQKIPHPPILRGKLSQIAINPSQKFLPLKVSRYTLPSCVTEREITV